MIPNAVIKIIQSVDMMEWSLATVHLFFVINHGWIFFALQSAQCCQVFFLFITVSLLLVLLRYFIMHIFVNMAVGYQHVVIRVSSPKSATIVV